MALLSKIQQTKNILKKLHLDIMVSFFIFQYKELKTTMQGT